MQILISCRQNIPAPWCTAFPEGVKASDPTHIQPARVEIVWLDLSGLKAAQRQLWLQQCLGQKSPLIVLSPTPSDDEAMAMLQQGASGYGHTMASADQLTEMALVVSHGGYWVGPHLIQRLLKLTNKLELVAERCTDALFNGLTEREQAVARAVARGASNREIASSLMIQERTVKAHLTAAFNKLGVRDRVQLALLVNNRACEPA